MDKNSLPHAELKLVQEVNNQHEEKVEASLAKPVQKCILPFRSECQISRLDLKSHNTYCSWNNQLFFEKHFDLGSVNHIMLIIDQPPSRSDFLMSFFCILPGQDLTLQHVSFGGQVANPVLRDKALRTWAGTEVANVCD